MIDDVAGKKKTNHSLNIFIFSDTKTNLNFPRAGGSINFVGAYFRINAKKKKKKMLLTFESYLPTITLMLEIMD